MKASVPACSDFKNLQGQLLLRLPCCRKKLLPTPQGPVSPEHMLPATAVKEPGEAGSSRILRGVFGVESSRHLGLDMAHSMQINTCVYIHTYVSFCSHRHAVRFPITPNILLGTVCTTEQEAQPRMNACWQLVGEQKHLAGFLHRNGHSATDIAG